MSISAWITTTNWGKSPRRYAWKHAGRILMAKGKIYRSVMNTHQRSVSECFWGPVRTQVVDGNFNNKVKGLLSEKIYCPPLTHIHTHTYIQAHKHTHIHIHTHAQTHRSHDEYSRGQNALCVSNTHLCWGEATVRGHSSISWPFDHYCTRSSRRRCHHVTQQNDVFMVHE